MNEDRNTRGMRRYIGLDIHKKYCVIGGVDREGREVLHAVRVEHAGLEGWLKRKLQSSDHVVFESTTNAWHVYDLLEPLVERVIVANPAKVKQIANARVKTDVRDTLILARLITGSQSGPGGLGTASPCARNASTALPAQATGGDPHTDRKPHAQCRASPSPEPRTGQTVQ